MHEVVLLRRVDGGCDPSIVCLRRVVVELVRRVADCCSCGCCSCGGGIMPARIASFTEEYVFIVTL